MDYEDIYKKLDNSWKTTTKILFGSEGEELKKYDDWLSRDTYGAMRSKSSLSKKEVVLCSSRYARNSKFISYDEIDFTKKFEPLSIDEIKDVDSIIEALKERFYYAGNIILGNSQFVLESTGIYNSHYVLRSSLIFQPNQYIYLCRKTRNCTNVFGSYFTGEINYAIRAFNSARSSRLLESYFTLSSSDVFYSYDIVGCRNIMFSFSLRNKGFVIGNLQLSKDKYMEISKSLKKQMFEELRSKKALPSIYELGLGEVELFEEYREDGEDEKNKEMIIEEINKVFSLTTKTLFNRELGDFREYEKYFLSSLPIRFSKVKSALSKKEFVVFFDNNSKGMPEKRIVLHKESYYLSTKLKLSEEEVKDYEKIKKSFHKIAFFPGETQNECFTTYGTPLCDDSSITYKVAHAYHIKRCAYSYYPRNSDAAFGCCYNIISNFCINCFYSEKIARCFEVDVCNNSSDLYFCHNVENIRQGMFCFNVKNLSYVIGNAEYSPSLYNKIRNSLIDQIADELERKKELRWRIHNIGELK